MPNNGGNHFCSTECLQVKSYYQSGTHSWDWIRQNVFTSKQILKQLLNSNQEYVWAIYTDSYVKPNFMEGTFSNIQKYIALKYSEHNIIIQRIKDDIIKCNEETISNLPKKLKKLPNTSIKCIIEGNSYDITDSQ